MTSFCVLSIMQPSVPYNVHWHELPQPLFSVYQLLIENSENIEQSVNQSNIIIKIAVICENNAAGILLPGIPFPPPAMDRKRCSDITHFSMCTGIPPNGFSLEFHAKQRLILPAKADIGGHHFLRKMKYQ